MRFFNMSVKAYLGNMTELRYAISWKDAQCRVNYRAVSGEFLGEI